MPGRKRDTLIPGSTQHQISLMNVGDVKWIETTAEDYPHAQREWNLSKSRRVSATRDFVIACSSWTAVSSIGKPVVILIRVERTK